MHTIFSENIGNRLDVLEELTFKVAYYVEITTVSGTISFPTGSTLLPDQWPGGKDAEVCGIPGGTGTPPDFEATSYTATLDAGGNYTVTGLPTNPAALFFYITIPLKDFNNLNTDNVIVYAELRGLDNPIDELKFNTSYIPVITSEGTVWWNENEYTLNVITGLGPTIQVGQETLLLYYNDTGVDIQNIRVIRPKAATVVSGQIVPTPELAQSNIFSKCEGTLAVTTMLIPDGQLGFAVVFGRARDGDTSGFTPGQGLWLSPTNPGELTNVRPEFPNYQISIGGALNSATAPDGEVFISVTRSILDTFNDAFDGSCRETIRFEVDSNGSIITGTLTNEDFPSDDITLIFSDGFYTFDTTPGATVTLTAGTSTVPQSNYIYIPKSTKVLTVNTSDWPAVDTEHIKIAQVVVQTAVDVQQKGALRNQNWNDHIKATSNNGHILHITEKLRQFEAQWLSGVFGSATLSGDALDVYFGVTSGVVYQLHKQTFNVLNTIPYTIDAVSQGSKTFTISDDGDLSSTFTDGRLIQVTGSTGNDGMYTIDSTLFSNPDFIITVEESIPNSTADGVIGDDMHAVNDFTTPYDSIISFSDITTDASGNALNNTSFSVVVWGIINKSRQMSHLMVNYPTDTYNKNFPDQAVNDASNYSVYDIPKTFQGVGFLISRVTLVNDGGTYSIYDTEDLRGKIPNTTAGGGGGGAGVTEFTSLTDTISSYTGTAGRVQKTNSAETALEVSIGIYEDTSGNVGIQTDTPDGVLDCTPDIIATDSYTYPFPRVTTTQRNAMTGMSNGARVDDITLDGHYVYDGTAWIQVYTW